MVPQFKVSPKRPEKLGSNPVILWLVVQCVPASLHHSSFVKEQLSTHVNEICLHSLIINQLLQIVLEFEF